MNPTRARRRLTKMWPYRADAVDAPATRRNFLLTKRADVAAIADDLLAEFGQVARAEQLSELATTLEKSGAGNADQIKLIRDTATALLEGDDEGEEDQTPQYEETDLVLIGEDGSETPIVIAKAQGGYSGGTPAGNVQDIGEPLAGGVNQQADLRGAGGGNVQAVSGPIVVRRKQRSNAESPGTPDNAPATQLHHDGDGDDDNRTVQRSTRYSLRGGGGGTGGGPKAPATGFNQTAIPGFPAGQVPVGGFQKSERRQIARAFMQYLVKAATGGQLSKATHGHEHMHDTDGDGVAETTHTHDHDHVDGTRDHSGDEVLHDHTHPGGGNNMSKTADGGSGGEIPTTGNVTVDAIVTALNKSVSGQIKPVADALTALTDENSENSLPGLAKRMAALEARGGLRKSADGQETSPLATDQPGAAPKEFGKGMFDDILTGARLPYLADKVRAQATS